MLKRDVVMERTEGLDRKPKGFRRQKIKDKRKLEIKINQLGKGS